MDRSTELWHGLSLTEQRIHIGNEVKRAVRYDDHPARKKSCLDTAITCTGKSMEDPKNERVLPELSRCLHIPEACRDGELQGMTKEQLIGHCMAFPDRLRVSCQRHAEGPTSSQSP